jgi:hypothetical protein
MVPHTTRETESRPYPADTTADEAATTNGVGTFAAGQSPLGRYEVTATAPVGDFARGVSPDAPRDEA